MKKKLLSVLMAAALSCSLFAAVPVVSQAEEGAVTYTEYTCDDWTYALDGAWKNFLDGVDNGCTIVAYSGEDTDISIPSTLDGHTVVGIGGDIEPSEGLHLSFWAPFYCADITSVVIPDTVQYIGPLAFNACANLTSVDFGNGVKYLDDQCFCMCKSLTSIDIPASMTSSDAYADIPFSLCSSIKTATIEDGGVKIPDSLFYNCTALEKIKIPNGIKVIGDRAFGACDSLSEITIPDSVQTIDDYAFGSCVSLETITIPNSVKTIGVGVFEATSLKEITIPDLVQTINESSFSECSSLMSITIPSSVRSINAQAFFGCTALEEITMPNSVQSIGETAFAECTSLKKITMTDSVKSIGAGAFYGCTSLTDFYDYNKNTEYGKDGMYPCIVSDITTMHGYLGSSAEKHAKENNITFVSLTGEDPGDPGSNPDDPGSDPDDPEAPVVEGSMFRLYNPNSGEHLYTSNSTEKNNLVSIGWKSEGTAWTAPASSNTPVYRVYNPNSGEHHYTMNSAEKDFLVGIGWNDEGIGWYSDDNQGTPLYRLYNPNAKGQYEAGGHHYTKDVNERKTLIAAGWRDEGIGWYGIKGNSQEPTSPEQPSGVTGTFNTAASIITALEVPAGYDGEFYIAWEAGFKDHPPAGEVRARVDSNTAYYFAAPGIDGNYAQARSVNANTFFNYLNSTVERLQQGGSGEAGVDMYIENGIATSMYLIES